MDMVKKQVIQYLYCGKSSLEMMEEIGKISKSSKTPRSEEHTSELQSQSNLVCRLLLEKKNHLGERVSPIDQHSELGGLDAHLAADSLGLHRPEQAQIFVTRRLDTCFLAAVLAEVVYQRVEPAGVRFFRDPNCVGHLLPGDPLPGKPGAVPR